MAKAKNEIQGNKVPKGIFDCAIQFYGINIEQMFFISFVFAFFSILGFVFSRYSMHIIAAGTIVSAIIYYICRISNYYYKGMLEERVKYALFYSWGVKRYSGRCKNYF